MATTVNYKGSVLTTVENQTRTLKTAGKYMEGDLTLVDVTRSGGVVIHDTTDSHGGTIREITADSAYTIDSLSVTSNGTYDAPSGYLYDSVSVAVPSSVVLQTKTATPTESAQTITPDTGYNGLSSVEVGAISSTYVGSEIDRCGSEDLSVLITDTTLMGVTRTSTTVTAYSGYYENDVTKNVSEMTVDAASSSSINNDGSITLGFSPETAGMAYTKKTYSVTKSNAVYMADEDDVQFSGQRMTAPVGYYYGGLNITLPSGSASTPATSITANPSISVSSGGLITATASASQSVTPSVSAGYVSAGTAGTITVSGSNTSQLTTQATQTLYPSTSDQTITSGKYLTGTQTFKGVAVSNTLIAANIKSGVTITIGDSADADRIMSVTGTYEGGGSSGKNVQVCSGRFSRTANSYGATGCTLTVAKAGTYKVTWMAWRSSSSGTMGTNLHKNSSAGTNQQTWTNTYGQCITLTNQTYAVGDVLTIYATSGSNSRTINVGNLIIEEV